MSITPLPNLPADCPESSPKVFAALFITLVVIYAIWLVGFWPGVLGEDSLAVIREFEGSLPSSGKSFFWVLFFQLLYRIGNLVEIPIAVILLFCALIFARILAWSWAQGYKGICFFLLFFICLSPHAILNMASLYPDAIFSIAISGFLFEIFICTQRHEVSWWSFAIISITLPIATFTRSNGVIFILIPLVLFFFLKAKSRLLIAFAVLFTIIISVTGNHFYKSQKQETLFPMVIYETVGFLKPRMTDFWPGKPRISPKTITALESLKPIDVYLAVYDSDYWDSLVYAPDGPRVGEMSQTNRKIIINEFFKHNIWRNFPRFLASRTNIFFAASFAQGSTLSTSYAKSILERTSSQSTYRRLSNPKLEQVLSTLYDFSYKFRWILWTPFLGIFLAFKLFHIGLVRRSIVISLVALSMLAQIAGIFLFNIAAEYRYMLPLFFVTVAFLPIVKKLNLPKRTNKTWTL